MLFAQATSDDVCIAVYRLMGLMVGLMFVYLIYKGVAAWRG